jgi:hypothetical protein
VVCHGRGAEARSCSGWKRTLNSIGAKARWMRCLGVLVRGMRKTNDVERGNHFNELNGLGAPSSFVPNIVCFIPECYKEM